MGRRGPQKHEQPDEEKGYYWVPQEHKGGNEMLVPRLIKHTTANKRGFRVVDKDTVAEFHKPIAQNKPVEPLEDDPGRMHRHKLVDDKKSNIKHLVADPHGNDRDLSAHLDEIAIREHKRLGMPSERKAPWFERFGIEPKFETFVPLDSGSSVPADEFTHEKLGTMYVVEMGPGTFLFHAPKFNLTKKFTRREEAYKEAEKFAEERLGEDIAQKAFNFINKAHILQKAEELQQSIYANYKSGNNNIELTNKDGQYSVKANNEEVLSTNDLDAALKSYYQQVQNLSGQKTEDSDISLDILGDKVVQMNREALAKLATLGNEEEVKSLLAKMDRLIKYEPQMGLIHGVTESEDANQGVQETGNKPSRLESKKFKYIESDKQPGYRESEVDNSEPYFKDKDWEPENREIEFENPNHPQAKAISTKVNRFLSQFPKEHLGDFKLKVYDTPYAPLARGHRKNALGVDAYADPNLNTIGLHSGLFDPGQAAQQTSIRSRKDYGGLKNLDNSELVISHELAHHVLDNNEDLTNKWINQHNFDIESGGFNKPAPGISKYGRSNHNERFAEAYQHYIFDPERLKIQDPNAYNFMRENVFRGKAPHMEMDRNRLQKERIYIPDEADAPKGTKVERGPRGGIYYDTENKARSLSPGDNGNTPESPPAAKKEKIDKKLATEVGSKLGIDFAKIDLVQFYVGMNVELEHGTKDPETNITNDDLLLTGKIAWIHIKEVPDYYTKLETNVDPEYAHLLETNKISKEEGMTPYIPEEFSGSRDIEQPIKVPPKYKDHEDKQDPIKFDNSMDGDEPEFYFKSEDIYDFLDEDYFSKMGVKYDPSQVLPLGARTIGRDIEKNLYDNLRKTIDNWYMTLNEKSALDQVKVDLKSSLLKWQANSNATISNDMQKLFEKGIAAGVRQSGVKIDQKAIEGINNQLNKPIGIIPALEHFQNQLYGKVSRAVIKNYDMENRTLPIQKTFDDITQIMIDQRYKTQLMIKSEVASLSHYGMLKAWEQDSDSKKYRYYWKAVIDGRTKAISVVRKQGNPYTFNEITFLWKNQEQLINGRWENDHFFQRCGLAKGRFKLDYNWKKNRFLGKENEFKETM